MQIDIIDLQFQELPGAIAAFLITGPTGKFLIESGPETCRETLLRELEERKVKPEELQGIFLTHIHLDHAGAAGWFAQQGVPLYVHRRGARHLVDPEKLIRSARDVYRDRFDSLWGEMTPAPGDLVHEIEDEESLCIGGLEVEAIETPGHAFHHHAFLIENAVFAGDSAGARLDDSGFISVTSAPPQFDLECTLASIERLSNLGKDRLFLTHFGEIPDPQEHWANYRDAVELNATFVRQRMDEGMDDNSLQIAYQAFQMEQAFRFETPRNTWDSLQAINGTEMCADGIRMYWQRKAELDRS